MTIISRWSFIAILTLTACLAFGADTTPGPNPPSVDIPALVKKAESGDANAQFYLGNSYATGEGVPKDAVLAVNWFRKAAEQGHTTAQFYLGCSYATGEGIPKDAVHAYMWLNLSAAQSHADAGMIRDKLSEIMTPAQIAEAQRLSREWKPTEVKK